MKKGKRNPSALHAPMVDLLNSTDSDLIESCKQVEAHYRGEEPFEELRFSGYVDVKKIRQSLKLSQEQFALRFTIPLPTVQKWEQGKRKPDRAASILLRLLERHSEIVDEVLKEERQGDETLMGKVLMVLWHVQPGDKTIPSEYDDAKEQIRTWASRDFESFFEKVIVPEAAERARSEYEGFIDDVHDFGAISTRLDAIAGAVVKWLDIAAAWQTWKIGGARSAAKRF